MTEPLRLTAAQKRVVLLLANGGSVIWAFGHEGKFYASPNWRANGGRELYGFYIAQRFIYPLNHAGLIDIDDPTFKKQLRLTKAGVAVAEKLKGIQDDK